MHFYYFLRLFPLEKGMVLLLNKLEFSFTQGCFNCESLIEIRPVVLEKMKIWNVYNNGNKYTRQQWNFDRKKLKGAICSVRQINYENNDRGKKWIHAGKQGFFCRQTDWCKHVEWTQTQKTFEYLNNKFNYRYMYLVILQWIQ